MKIGILTHPLHTNYGGILQAYALQSILRRMGCKVEIVNREYNISVSTLERIKTTIKRILFITKDNKIRKFIKTHFSQTPALLTTKALGQYTKKRYDAIIVGSDQVWRPQYSPNIYNYYLDFTENDIVTKIAYAASFGVDEWEYTSEETTICSELAKKFDAISVREYSGIDLCREHLGVYAQHVLDPTMLLSMNDYIKLVDKAQVRQSKGDLFCYVLDKDYQKQDIIDSITNSLNLHPFYCMPNLSSSEYPSVEQWIRGFIDARMVVTDSFHGTVFSIIFNKPFWVIGNEKRGLSRFESLLKMFGLEDRLIRDSSNIDYNTPIFWNSVDIKLNDMRKKSHSFLLRSLGK